MWKNLDQSKKNSWFIIAVIATILFIAILSNGKNSDTKNQTNEITVLKAQVDSLQKQIESEKQQNIESFFSPSASEEEILKEEPTQKPSETKEEIFKVVNVVDGDTVKLESGEVVRYIGIDSPETMHPSKPVQCFGKDAGEKNRELVEGKEVRLVKDVSETDKYGRLLRYVYVGDIFVNDYFVRNGYAKASSYPPDVKYQDQFRQAEEEARNNKRGLWADNACENKNTEKAELKPAPTPEINIVPPNFFQAEPNASTETNQPYTCNCQKTCGQMGCAEAQYQLNTCGCSARDRDGDGVACDADCH